MNEIKERSIFIHIDVPGHEDNAPNLPDRYVCVCVCVCVQNIGTVSVWRISFTMEELIAVIEKISVMITFMLVSSSPDYCFINKVGQKVFFFLTLCQIFHRGWAMYLQIPCLIFGMIRSVLSHNVPN
jgi:hypothetical protein